MKKFFKIAGRILVIILIIIIVLQIIVLLRRDCFGCGPVNTSINELSPGIQKEINNLFGDEDKNLVVDLGPQKTAIIKQGTQNFGIAIGFTPDNPNAWGEDNKGCKYDIEAIDPIIMYGIAEVGAFLSGTSNVTFDEVEGANGYSIILIEVPKHKMNTNDVQRFELTVNCKDYPTEKVKTYFDIEVIEKGIF